MGFRTLCLTGFFVLFGCGGDDGGTEPPASTNDGGTSTGSGRRQCMDEDGDGYGPYCGEGLDCDDDDPEITDECRRCRVPNKDCPCEPGTKPLTCDPDDVETTQNGVKGVLVCSEGARYCRDGAWSDCEIIWMYTTFVATE